MGAAPVSSSTTIEGRRDGRLSNGNGGETAFYALTVSGVLGLSWGASTHPP